MRQRSGSFCGSSAAVSADSAAPKTKYLIEVAPFGRLDQMLRPAVNETKRKKQKTKRTLLKKDFLIVVIEYAFLSAWQHH